MSTKWTDNQLLAINARDGDVLVSAAAGSGKTAVLVERVIRMVLDPVKPVSIDRLLIVTYTRAAAAQLKDRISSKLSELILLYPDNKYYRRQLALLPRAHISTVDSFCSDLCREFFHELDIRHDYKIAEQGELSVISSAALEETVSELYESRSDDFYDLVKCFSSSKSDKALGENILKLYEFLRSHPFLDLWLDEKLSYYTDFTSAADSIWGRVILKNAERIASYALSLAKKNIAVAEEEPEFFSKVSELLSGDKLYFEKVIDSLKNSSWDEIRETVYSFYTGVLSARGFTQHSVKLKTAANRDILKSCVAELKALFEADEKQCVDDIKALYPIVSSMFECVRLYHEKYSNAKKSANLADFSDVEHWALELLVKEEGDEFSFTDTAKVIASRFDSVLVDEYQDANEVQDLIFKAVSKESNLFIVGDAKQSIYAFRQAMPEIFINRKNSCEFYSADKNNYPAKIILEKNFRSRVEVTDFVNFCFDRLMTAETGDINYADGEGLVSGASYPSVNFPCNELHLIDVDAFEDEEEAIVYEARHIASVIREQLDSTLIKDGESQRRCTYGDIAILLRSGKKNSAVYVRELEKFGIPATFESSSSFFELEEIRLCLSILRVIDNPLQDIPLLSSMLSPVFGFTPDDLAEIRAGFPKGAFYSAVLNAAKEEGSKAHEFSETLDTLRTLAVTMTASQFINTLYDRLGLISVCGCMGSDRSVSNLRLLSEYALKFEQGSLKGINAFVSYLDKLIENGNDLPSSVAAVDNALNAVTIMTVHASKGLEYPVCILAGTQRKFSTDTTDNVLLHSRLGFAAKRRDNTLGTSYNTFVRKALAIEKKQSEMSEELRVLYVALTRPKEKLIMTAAKKNISKYLSTLASKLHGDTISPYVVAGAKSISDWLFMVSLLHKDGNLLRGIANAEVLEYSNNKSGLLVRIVDDLSSVSATADVTRELTYEAADENLREIMDNRFSFVYPDSALCGLPLKVTASQLAGMYNGKEYDKILAKPKFINDTAMTAAERGTAMHKFLQFCSFDLAKDNLELEVERLKNIRLSEKECNSLDLKKLRRFIESDIVSEALSSKCYREYRFTVNIPASLTGIEGVNSDYPVILQGAVDLLYIKDRKITIVDYKTDRVDSVHMLTERYKKQLELYKEAVSACFDMYVSRCIIYSIHTGEYEEVKL